MPHKVFIGYSLEDKLVADAACAALEAQRIPCWIAPRDILTNDESGEAISEMLAQCPIVLLIFSSNAVDSPEVRREIDWAVSKGKIIVPFRVDDLKASETFKFAHGKTHWLDALTSQLEVHLTQLCNTISRLLAEHKVAEAPLWTMHDTTGAEATTHVIVPESVKQNSAVADTIPAPTRNSAPEQKVKPHVEKAAKQAATVQPIPYPVYSWPSPPQSPAAESKTIHREETKAPVLKAASEQTESPHLTQVSAHPVFTTSPDFFPAPSAPGIHMVESTLLFGQVENETVAHKRLLTTSRMTFAALFCIAAVIMVFLFLRQSKQSPVKAHTEQSSSLESPVAPFLNPSQPTLTPANTQQAGVSNTNSELPQQVQTKKEVVPEISQPALKAQQAGSTKIEQTRNEASMKQGATHVPSTPVGEENNLVWIDFATGMMWAKRDSGDKNDLTWKAASDYCKNLQLDGHNDWRLPNIDELQGIYDTSISTPGQCCGGQSKTWHVKGNLTLSGWQWSSTQGDSPQKAVYLNFSGDEELTAPIGNSESLRALCVRKAGD